MASVPAPLIRSTAADAIAAVQASGGPDRVPAPLTWNPSRHLQSRFGFGPVRGSAAVVPDKWIRTQLALPAAQQGYAGVPALAGLYPLLGQRPGPTRKTLRAAGNEYAWTSMEQLNRATLALQCWSPSQLYESVVDFFSNKLNVPNFTDTSWSTRVSYDRDVIRRFAFGKYRDMLQAAMRHSSMLGYLSNDASTYDAPNENLGRELLELHTVGVGAGYTQDDVVNSARILSGRGIDPRVSDYMWSQGEHWLGPVKVLGFGNANGDPAQGEAVGTAYLTYLANHPATAANLARQLCVRFVSDSPSDALVAAVAAAYSANDTAIVPMLKTILYSTEFWDSRGAKTRRPLENLIATVRALGLQPVDQAGHLDGALTTFTWMAQGTGQLPLSWAPPNGYPDVAAAWRSAGNLLAVWRNQFGLVQNWGQPHLQPVVAATLIGGSGPQTVGAALDAIATTLVGQPLTGGERATLLTYLGEDDSMSFARSKLQWELPNVAALVLHGAAHAYR